MLTKYKIDDIICEVYVMCFAWGGDILNSNEEAENNMKSICTTLRYVKRKIAYSIEQVAEPILQKHGVTLLQFLLLTTLYQFGPTTVTELCKELRMGQANTSSLCKKMERAGLLIRKRCEIDERKVTVEISQNGTDKIRGIEADMSEIYDVILNFPQERLSAIEDGFKALQELLDLIVDNRNKQ